jgi:hypothetical protein
MRKTRYVGAGASHALMIESNVCIRDKRKNELDRLGINRAVRPERLRRLRFLRLGYMGRRSVPLTTMSTLRPPHCEQTSRFLNSGTAISAPIAFGHLGRVGSTSCWHTDKPKLSLCGAAERHRWSRRYSHPRRRLFMAASAAGGRSPGFDVGSGSAMTVADGSSMARMIIELAVRRFGRLLVIERTAARPHVFWG